MTDTRPRDAIKQAVHQLEGEQVVTPSLVAERAMQIAPSLGVPFVDLRQQAAEYLIEQFGSPLHREHATWR